MPKTIRVERDVDTGMRDGTILRADIYRPDEPGPLPTLLQRTPYGKGDAQTAFALAAAERGYAVVFQDTRGRWASQGENYPLLYEKNDGYDTLDWISRQPWCTGNIGMFGGSYPGYTQLAAAASGHPALKAIIPAVTFCDPSKMVYSGGALSLGILVSWGLLAITQMDILRFPGEPEEKARLMADFIALVNGMSAGHTFSHLPLNQISLLSDPRMNRFFLDAMDASAREMLWDKVICPYDRITVPALHIGGWYDAFIASTLQDFSSLQPPNLAGQPCPIQKLLVGPWTHGTYENLSGETDFGLQASWMLVVPDEMQLRWFDYWLKGLPNGVIDEPPVRIFVMGDNYWRDEHEWPLKRTQYTPYYLHSHGLANTSRGDGVLSTLYPGDEAADTFVYDPHNPVPTRGGGLLGWQAALPPGAYDQREIEARSDVLVYTTSVLESDLEVTGPLLVRLWVATSAPATDFTAKLVDVHHNGYAQNLQDGIVRSNPLLDQQIPLQPGVPQEFVISLAATSNVFKAGHCLRLEISSSNFPRFDRNPNSGALTTSSSFLQTAKQTIFHDAAHPSCIILPVIPR